MTETAAHLLDQPALVPAPASPVDWPAWRDGLRRWRLEARQALGYDDRLYQDQAFQWASAAFACGFVFMYDSGFYDRRAGRYTVEALLRQANENFGGYDAVVLWHAYPRLGFDARNQFDFYRHMPGGLAGLREACRQFQANGVRVFLNYNPWDTGTRREGRPDTEALADMVQALGADGLFLDTMTRGARDLRDRLDAVRPGLVLESEGALPLANLPDHHMSWAQKFEDSPAPGVLRNKWFEPRHMQHLIWRWNHNHSAELHTAWMNGCGLIIWENVFGSWVGWNARDKALLRSMLPVQRRYHQLFSAGQWTPLVNMIAPPGTAGVYASLWEHEGLRLWTLINRGENAARTVLQVEPPRDQTEYYDLIAGRALAPASRDGAAQLEIEIGPRGLGAILAGQPAALGLDLPAFLERQADLRQRASDDTRFPAILPVPHVAPATARVAVESIPMGMIAIPSATLDLETEFRIRECGFCEPDDSVLFEAPHLHSFKTFRRLVTLAPYAIDLTPVTNAQYAEFLAATGYQPAVTEQFLAHWPARQPPAGLADHPVVFVDLDDARAYAAWAGKRLPTEAEWQFAAEGIARRRFPWGNRLLRGAYNDGSGGGTTPVTAHPRGRSPFGGYDLCGNVWQWTESEHSDGRTRFCLVRGGAYFKAQGSDWYADGGPAAGNFAAKFLLLWPGIDRCATIGFRCAVDVAP